MNTITATYTFPTPAEIDARHRARFEALPLRGPDWFRAVRGARSDLARAVAAHPDWTFGLVDAADPPRGDKATVVRVVDGRPVWGGYLAA